MECSVCKSNRELRLGVCFNCAEAESIISEGLDMYDKGPDGSSTPAKYAIDKVKFLVQKGIIKSDKK